MPGDALSKASAVFVGTAEDVAGDFMEHRVKFRVEKKWKGAVGDTLEIRTHAQGPACGYHFEAGTRYLVYAYEWKGALQVSSCSRTRKALQVTLEGRLLDAAVAGKNAETAYDELARAGRDERQPELRAEAIRLLAELRGPRLTDLAGRALEDPSPLVRREIAGHLQSWEARPMLPAIAAAFERETKRISDPVCREALTYLSRTVVRIGTDAQRQAAVPWLVDDLKSASWMVRAESARALADAGPIARAAAPALRAALKDSNEFVRSAASEALRKVGDIQLSELVAQLDDSKHTVRETAARAIFDLGTAESRRIVKTRVVPMLIEELRKEPDLSISPLMVLEHIAPCAQEAIPVLEGAMLREGHSYVEAGVAARALGSMGRRAKKSIPALLTALGRKEESLQSAAAWSLGQMGKAASGVAPELVALLDAVSWETGIQRGPGRTIAIALASIGTTEASSDLRRRLTPKLVPLLESPTLATRQAALYLLAEARATTVEALPSLRANLRHADVHVRRDAARALASLGASAAPAEPELAALLGEKDTILEAARALAAIGARAHASEEPLKAAMARGDEAARANIATALRALGTSGAMRAYQEFVARELPVLVARLAPDGQGSGEAARTLALFPDQIAATRPALERALANTDWLTRTKAAEALGKARSRGSLGKLRRLLCDPNSYVWRAAYQAIEALKDGASERTLRDFEDGKCW